MNEVSCLIRRNVVNQTCQNVNSIWNYYKKKNLYRLFLKTNIQTIYPSSHSSGWLQQLIPLLTHMNLHNAILRFCIKGNIWIFLKLESVTEKKNIGFI